MRNLKCGLKVLTMKYTTPRRFNILFYHHSVELDDEPRSLEWYERAYPKLIKMTHILKNVDQNEGRLMDVRENSIITNDKIIREMQMFKSLARAFIGSPSVQQALEKAVSSTRSIPSTCFSKLNEREPLVLDSLVKVCDFLNISAQQRKSVRLTICPQITQHHIWRGTLEMLLSNLKLEMDTLNCHSSSTAMQMGEQIVLSCLQFLAETMDSSNPDSSSWMWLASTKKPKSPPSREWAEVQEMFEDLVTCLRHEERLAYHLLKIQVMREGLYQIKQVLVDRDIGYKEARHQERLVQKKLTQALGLSSKCLFTLLLYYLYGSVGDIEIDVCGGLYGKGSSFCLCIGKILTSNDEKMVWRGVKQLDRALGLFKFVWDTTGLKGLLKLQGHIWCVGAEERTLSYRGKMFFVHGIRP